MYWLIFLLVVVAFVIYKSRNTLLYWKDRGIAYRKPVLFITDFLKLFLGRQSFYDNLTNYYDDYPNERFSGMHLFGSPTILIRDLELIKKILVKDFDYFTDHFTMDALDEKLFKKNLMLLKGQEWRDMRATLSPAFTASKMKAMFHLITECADNLAKHFADQHKNEITLEMKDLFTRFTNDVIATCAFGVQCDSLKDKDNTFFMMGREVTQFSFFRNIKFMILFTIPKLLTVFGLTLFPKNITDFFIKTVSETIAYRTEHGIVRPDMIHLLMQARKGKLEHEEHEELKHTAFSEIEESNVGKQKVGNKEYTDLDIAAQAFIFFLAGFETSSTIMSFMSYELALNPDIQETLLREIDDVMDATNNKPTYEYITNMKYLDMVLSETLRKWPQVPIADRVCVKDYTIKAEKQGEQDFLLKKGEIVGIPILSLHRSEQYFLNPEKFDPNRFLDENKHNIIPFTYIPFGLGPRSCIGNRFALLEIKILFTYLLAKFELIIVDKSSVPLKLAPGVQLKPINGFWLGLKARK